CAPAGPASANATTIAIPQWRKRMNSPRSSPAPRRDWIVLPAGWRSGNLPRTFATGLWFACNYALGQSLAGQNERCLDFRPGHVLEVARKALVAVVLDHQHPLGEAVAEGRRRHFEPVGLAYRVGRAGADGEGADAGLLTGRVGGAVVEDVAVDALD